ncbi:MAG: NADH-quinone oxidoreductase subunit G [Cellulomonas sp.]
MTTTPKPSTGILATPPPAVIPPLDPATAVTFSIDDIEMAVPKGTLVIRAAEKLGIAIPRFCDHPLLAPVGACRQCLVEVWAPGRDGKLSKMPKPQPSCTLEATPGMQVKTQLTSGESDKAQHGVMEMLLINHPLDCPVCDKGGECPLQNQSMSNGRGQSRYLDIKRTFPKPIAISTQILLDRDRCIMCQRCTRFQQEIAGDPFIDLQKRGANQQIGRFDTGVLGFETGVPAGAGRFTDMPVGPAALSDESGAPFASYFSGNVIQICPVGALTSSAYRFRSRPFDLVSTPGISEHDSSGSAIRVDHRRGVVMRRLAGEDPAVNEEWITDKDRFAFTWQAAPDRLRTPLVRDPETGELIPASWSEALEVAAAGLAAAMTTDAASSGARGVGVLPGGRLTIEDAYAYAKFARVALGTNDIDLRSRPHSAEEEAFLAASVAGRPLDVTFADLERSPRVLLVALEAEEEAGVVFLRLRKGVLAGRTHVTSLAPFAGRALERLAGTLLAAAPGTEPEVLDAIAADAPEAELSALAAELALDGALILVGERLGAIRGGLTAVRRLADRTGARLAWIPRRAGERGGIEVGALPSLLPGGRPVAQASARVDVAAVWGVDHLPEQPGRSTSAMLEAARTGSLAGLVVGGVDVRDLPDPAAAREALAAVGFLVSLEIRPSDVTALADVVLPVAPPVEKPGTYVNWEGRPRPFPQALTSTAMSDHRVLDALADALGATLGLRTLTEVHRELDEFGAWEGERIAGPQAHAVEPPAIAPGHAVLATWHQLLDSGHLQDGEAFLAGTAKRPVARISAATAAGLGVADGDLLDVSSDAGTVTLPLALTVMGDHIVWLPTCSPGSEVRDTLRIGPGALVRLAAGADLTVGTDSEVQS